MAESSHPRYQAFLSHNSADKPAVEELARRLEQDGISCFLDKWHLIPGDSWQVALEEALDQSACCVVFVGPSGLGPWQNEEMRAAIAQRVSTSSHRVVPVLLPGAQREQRSRLPAFLVSAMWVEFRSSIDEEDGYHRLKCGIRGVAPGPSPGEALFEGECPYRGLQVFDADHARFFFGRDAEVDWILHRLAEDFGTHQEGRFLGVVGASGSGKSSLVLAGLVPAIRDGRSRSGKSLPDSTEWPIVTLRPGNDPLKALADALWSNEISRPLVSDPLAFAEQLLDREVRLHATIETLLADAPQSRRFVVVVDQFEELFTQCDDEAQQKAFIDNLMYAASIHGGRALVVVTMRADFYGKCSRYEKLAHALSDRQELVPPLGQPELRAAIEQPAQLCGLELEPGLTDLLLQDMREQPAGALPLLQQTLLMLWERREGRRLTIQAYRDIGEIEGALEAHANQIYEQALDSDEQREVCRRVLLMLTTPGEGTEDTRRRVPRSQLGSSDAVDAVLQQLVKGRLVTLSDTNPPRVEVTHEALIRGWHQLREWLDEDRESLRILQQLVDAAEEWEANDRDPAYLYAGSRLSQAEEWRSQHAEEVGDIPLATEFIDVAVERRDAETRRLEAEERQRLEMLTNLAETERQRAKVQEASKKRLRGMLAVVAALLVVACVMGGFAYHTASELKATASELNERNDELSVTNDELDGQKDELQKLNDDLEDANENLETERNDLRVANERLEEQTAIANAARDEKARELDRAEWLLYAMRIASAQREWEAANMAEAWNHLDSARWDFRGWEHDYLSTLFSQNQQILRGHLGPVSGVAYSPDGTRIVSSGNSVRVWEAASGREAFTITTFTFVDSVAFSPDGAQIAGIRGRNVNVWDAANGQETHLLSGHTGTVNNAAFSPDGTQIASGSDDETVRVWDAVSGQPTHTLKGHNEPVNAVAFSPDGSRIVSGSGSLTRITNLDGSLARLVSIGGTLKIWNAATGEEVLSMEGHSAPVNSVAFNPGGTRVVSASDDQSLKVWDAETGHEILTIKGHTGRVTSVAFHPKGREIVSASVDGTVKVWSTGSGEEVLSLLGHTDSVTSVAFSPDGAAILSGSEDETVRIWDADSSQGSKTLAHLTDPLTRVTFTADGARIVGSSADKSVRVWDVDSGEEVFASAKVNCLAVSSGATRIVSGIGDESLKVWDTVSGREIIALDGLTARVTCVAITADGTRIVSGSEDESLTVWDAVNGRELHSLEGNTDRPTRVAFNPNGSRIVSGHFDRVKVWDAASGEKILERNAHNGGVASIRFSPDGTQFVTRDGWTVIVWDALNGEELFTIRSRQRRILFAVFSPDGKQIVTAGEDGTVRMWDTESGHESDMLQGHTLAVRSVSVSTDGTRIVSGSDDETAKIWDAASGQELLSLNGQRGSVTSVEFSPDGRHIVTSSDDGMVKLWDASRAQEPLTLEGHTLRVTDVAFSGDGTRIISCSGDDTIRLWDATSGQETLKLKTPVRSVALSPDGTRIASGGVGSRERIATVKLWDAVTGDEIVGFGEAHLGPVVGVEFSQDGNAIVSASNDGTVIVTDAASGQQSLKLSANTNLESVRLSPNGSLIIGSGLTTYVWDAVSGQKIHTLGDANSAVFSPDATRILRGGSGGKLHLWDVSRGREIFAIDGHSRAVRCVAVNPDGTRFVTASQDQTLRLWDATNLQEILVLREHTADVLCVAFSPDGTRIISGDAAGALKLWNVADGPEPLR